jgi:glutamate N-acetyltransferase/amino-acid N-acetyltransferase
MATGDPARAPGSAARGWRARARPEGESALSSSIARGEPAARLRRRLARPCLASVSAGAAGAAGAAGTDPPTAADAAPGVKGSSAGRGDARDGTGGGGGGVRASETSSKGASSSSDAHPSSPKTGFVSARTSTGARLLPLWEHRPGAPPRQYALDGDAVRLVSPEEADALAEANKGNASARVTRNRRDGAPRDDRFDAQTSDALPYDDPTSLFSTGNFHKGVFSLRKRFARLNEKARDAFLPAQESVTEDYWEYARFRFYQRAASSCITVFATQQMLQAIGLGATRRLPAAAAVNWVLKDGLGRLGKLSVATNFGREFDSDVKRFRFTSSVVYDCASLVEMLTPFYPKRFLLLATVANVGKSVGITTANVVRAPIQRSFALEENLAEITAKTSAQQVLADNLGLGLAVVATSFTGKIASANARLVLPLIAFCPLAATDLYCIYRELKAVQLKTINRERGEIVAELFVKNGKVPSFKTVADAERLFIPARLDESTLPLKVTGLAEACPTKHSLVNALSDDPETPYVLSYLFPSEFREKRKSSGQNVIGAFFGAAQNAAFGAAQRAVAFFKGEKRIEKEKRMKGHATLALAQHATSRDVMQAVLQVAHLRALPFRGDLDKESARRWALEESRFRAERDVDEFSRQLVTDGWLAGKVLLSSAERAPYRVEGEVVRALATASDTEGQDEL